MQDITAFDIFDYLPLKIQELLFSQYMDNAMENIFSIASIPTDKQVELHRDVVSVLIGKYNIEKLTELLKTKYSLNDSMIKLVMNFLNSKIFNFLKVEMQKSRSIYEQAKKEGVSGAKRDVIIQEKISNKSPGEMVSYIQELASALKKEPEKSKKDNLKKEIEDNHKKTKDKNKIVVTKQLPKKEVETKNEHVSSITKPSLPKEKVKTEVNNPVDNAPVVIEKEEEKGSILLQAMRKNKTDNTGKLNEYYKSLKNNLNTINTSEENTVFQPPFKSNSNKRVLIESSFNNTKQEKIENKKNNFQEFKTPVKYNSFNYSKKEAVNKEPHKNNSKFIDLGDFD